MDLFLPPGADLSDNELQDFLTDTQLSGVTRAQRKRVRTQFTPSQVEFLKAAFNKSPYTTRTERIFMSTHLKLPEYKIRIWYQNRRMKAKKEKSDTGSTELDSTSNVNQIDRHYDLNQSFSQNQNSIENIQETTQDSSPESQPQVNHQWGCSNLFFDQDEQPKIQNPPGTTLENILPSLNVASAILSIRQLPLPLDSQSNGNQINPYYRSNQSDWCQSHNSVLNYNPIPSRNSGISEQNTPLQDHFTYLQQIANCHLPLTSAQVNSIEIPEFTWFNDDQSSTQQ